MRTALALTVLVVPLLVPHGAAAQGAAGQAPPAQPVASAPSASELAKQAQNPIASLISFPLEGNWDMGVGDREATSTLLNIQPVVPFAASKSTNVVLRVIMPLMSQPSAESDSIRNNAFGDILLSTFLTPAKAAPIVNKVTSLNTLVLCGVLLWVYRSDIFSAVGTYAIGTQILCYTLLGFGSYLLGFGLSYDQKAPMTLGTCTRNVGPALATLMGVAGAPQGATTMYILAIFLGAILSGFAAAAVMKRFCAPADRPAAAQTA